MSTTAAQALVLGVLALATSVLLAWKRTDPKWRRAFPGLVATALAVYGFLGSYFWLFEIGTCEGKSDLACVLNENQGFMTLLALIFAGLGLWIAAFSRWADQRAAHEAEVDATREALVAATDEVTHNLVHCGSAWHEDGWHGFMPQLTVSAVRLLLEPEYRKHLSPRVAQNADAVARNWEAFRDIPPGWGEGGEVSDRTPRDPPNRFPDFVSRSCIFLVVALRDHPSWCSERLAEQPRLRSLRDAAREDSIRFAFASSSLVREGPSLRVRDTAVLCWWEDETIPDVRIYTAYPLFSDLARGHRH